MRRPGRAFGHLSRTVAAVAFLCFPGLTAAAEQPAPGAVAAPSPLEPLWTRGEKLLQDGDADGALSVFREALKLEPGNGRSLNYIGGVFFTRGEYTLALDYFRQAVRALPTDARAVNNLGTAYDRLGRTTEAVENYLEAIRLEPEYPVPYRNLGAVYAYRLRDVALAEKYWTEFLRLAPPGPDRDNVQLELRRLTPSR